MDDFINSMINGENYNETARISYNRLVYGVDSINDTDYLFIPDGYNSLPLIPGGDDNTVEKTLENMRKRGIIGIHDYPIRERRLNPTYINKLPPPYDNLYKNIPPESMISNKARIMPMQRNRSYTIPPQNINDMLKPLNRRFNYFVKPTPSYETQELLNTETDQSLINDFAEDIIPNYKDNKQSDIHIKRSDLYVPANFYTHQWHTYNKDFIINKIKNDAALGNSTPFIDPRFFKELKRLYPTASEYILRANYDALLKKHKLNTRSTNESKNETVSERLIRTNGVIARLAALLDGVANRQQLKDKINEITQFIPFTYLTSRFPSVNRNIMQRNQDLYKLAFICGSTNESIVNDIADISKYIGLLIRA